MHKQHPQTAYRKYAVLIGTIFENCDNKKVSFTWKMKDRGKNRALFHHIRRFHTPHRHLMGEYPVQLPALLGQVRMHIALQGNVGIGVSEQFTKGLYIATRLQTGRCKGVAQRMRAHLPDSCLLQIRLDTFPITAGLCGFGFITR